MPDTQQRLELTGELGSWEITLTTGAVIEVAAHAYAKEQVHYVFSALMTGTPNFEVELVKIPVALVATIRGG